MKKAALIALILIVGIIAFIAGRASRSVDISPCSPQPVAVTNVPTESVQKPVEQKIRQEQLSVAATNKVVELRRFDFNDNGRKCTIRLDFTRMPTLNEVRRFVTITPDPGELTMETDSWSEYYTKTMHNVVELSGAGFKHRTQYTVTVSPEIVFSDGYRLDHDYVRDFMRRDLNPEVTFCDAGRYLPPVGDRVLAIETVNCSNVVCSTRAVPVANIVQLLAREEGKYCDSTWRECIPADDNATEEIAAAAKEWRFTVPQEVNVRRRSALSLQNETGIASNGVYLVTIRGNGIFADADGKERTSDSRYKLVCLTDLGMSVRCDRGMVRTWITSFAKGRPVGGVKLSLFADNGIPLGSAETAANGEAEIALKDDRYAPFALIAEAADGEVAFMALEGATKVDEPAAAGERPAVLEAKELDAFVWTERGIYRHGEKVMVQAIVRDGTGKAPAPLPLVVSLLTPNGKVFKSANVKTDGRGALQIDEWLIPDDQPSGKWTLRVALPGERGATIGSRSIKVEEFVPPQIKVKFTEQPGELASATNLSFTLQAEHLFGGPAKNLSAQALVAFSDAEFHPTGWERFTFGDCAQKLTPKCIRQPWRYTDERGEAKFNFGIDTEELGLPGAAVKVTVQGAVIETGGRPASVRTSKIVHYHPFYLGVNVPSRVQLAANPRAFKVAVVAPDGKLVAGERMLAVSLMKHETVYNLRQRGNSYSWESEKLSHQVETVAAVAVGADGTGVFELPLSADGDYELLLTDETTGRTCRRKFWVAGEGDDEIRSSLANPTAVTITPDKEYYRAGEMPVLTVKSPFKGSAWLAVMREGTLYTRAFELTNATSTVELEPLVGDWAPNVDVALSVVQSVRAGANHLASRAHGLATLRIRPIDRELPVKVTAASRIVPGGSGSILKVKVDARGEGATGETAVVTVVDEGINLLTDEPVPDPVAAFAAERQGKHPLYDYFHALLPVYEGDLMRTGVKTGGDELAELMGRVSMVPTRRFKSLAQWRFEVPLPGGVGETEFKLPEFVGEVRVTAVAYSARATGAAATRVKVAPALVSQPDAPRFAAPGDTFEVVLALTNRSGSDGTAAYEITASDAVAFSEPVKGVAALKAGESTLLYFSAHATAVGEGRISFNVSGFGEEHPYEILLPVRPPAAWSSVMEVKALAKGERYESDGGEYPGAFPGSTRRSVTYVDSPFAPLLGALEYLDGYPYGCLEQTCSRVFPLIHAGGLLAKLPVERTSKASERDAVIRAGIARVESMVRDYDFVMWPDCNVRPYDLEVSLWAAHFLIEAKAAGYPVGKTAEDRVLGYLRNWMYNSRNSAGVYAVHTLALAKRPEKDRMFHYYDLRASLSLLDRARLARAFVRTGDPVRARELVRDSALAPQSVKEAAFALLALVEMDPEDARIPALVTWLEQHRDHARFHWGTTESNAHALLALTAYYNARGADGAADRYAVVRTRYIPTLATRVAANNILSISRRYVTVDGKPASLDRITRGDLLFGEITLSADRDITLSDLIVEDLFPAALEPDSAAVSNAGHDWVLRTEKRDDRLLVFSKKIKFEKDKEVTFRYALRAVSAGDYIVPGPSVEAMYAPDVRACGGTDRIVVRH